MSSGHINEILIKTIYKMKNVINQIFSSKKWWYTVSAIFVPIISKYCGTDEETSFNIFVAFLTLTGAQGIADLRK